MKLHLAPEDAARRAPNEADEGHRVVIRRPDVLLEIEWDDEVLAELPDDLTLNLTVKAGDGASSSSRAGGGGGREGAPARLAFRWSDENAPTTLRVIRMGTAEEDGDRRLWQGVGVAEGSTLPAK